MDAVSATIADGGRAIIVINKPMGPAALRHMDRQTVSSILLLLCLYICSTYYVQYVEYKYRSARKPDFMDTSNPPQANVDMNTATINVD